MFNQKSHFKTLLKETRPQQLMVEEVPLGEQHELDSATLLVQINALVLQNIADCVFFVKPQEFKSEKICAHKLSNNKLYLLVTSYILNIELRIETAGRPRGGDPPLGV